MARGVKRHLKVAATPQLDESELIVRMHETDLPGSTRWGRYLTLWANQRKISCKVHSISVVEVKAPREHKISINKHLKSKLDIKPGTTVDFYIKKASRLKAPYYILRYHPNNAVRKKVFLKVLGITLVLLVAATFAALYFVVWR
jgi:hypothetical protein